MLLALMLLVQFSSRHIVMAAFDHCPCSYVFILQVTLVSEPGVHTSDNVAIYS